MDPEMMTLPLFEAPALPPFPVPVPPTLTSEPEPAPPAPPAPGTLPQSERDHLASLPTRARNLRLARLTGHGWTLAALGASFDPPFPRTTIHYWVQNAKELTPIASAAPLSPLYAQATAEPPLPDPPRPRRFPNTRIRGISPRVPADMRPVLASLAVQARRYRAKTSENSPPALANTRLTELALTYRSQGVPTADIAAAAGVSYRAMARRIARAQ